jgi:uncharacterized membrane protein
MDEAMNFIISGGAVAPERIQYHRGAPTDLPAEGETRGAAGPG